MQYVACVSGGLDSAVLLYSLTKAGHGVAALSFNYGQRHVVELNHARRLCKLLGVEHREIDLSALAGLFSSALVGSATPIPEGHYAAENMRSTIVPNRNAIMLNVCAAWAVSVGADGIACGVHAGDHAVYPDCRPEFVEALNASLKASTGNSSFQVLAPFLHKTKAEIVTLGGVLEVPFELTWSCYNGREHHCGKCGTCVERKEAFSLAGVPDNTGYEV